MKFISNTALDAALNVVQTANKLVILSAYPTTFTQANSTYKLAEVDLTAGDYTLANGDIDGRKITVAAKSDIPITANGTPTHAALITGSSIIAVTEISGNPSVIGNTHSTPAFAVTVRAAV